VAGAVVEGAVEPVPGSRSVGAEVGVGSPVTSDSFTWERGTEGLGGEWRETSVQAVVTCCHLRSN
jgi:hypothetical protein